MWHAGASQVGLVPSLLQPRAGRHRKFGGSFQARVNGAVHPPESGSPLGQMRMHAGQPARQPSATLRPTQDMGGLCQACLNSIPVFPLLRRPCAAPAPLLRRPAPAPLAGPVARVAPELIGSMLQHWQHAVDSRAPAARGSANRRAQGCLRPASKDYEVQRPVRYLHVLRAHAIAGSLPITLIRSLYPTFS
jgi:hypothetical protein